MRDHPWRLGALLPWLSLAGGLPTAAVCISGQARTLPDTAWKIRKRLLEPWEQFGGAASFVFVSRRSYYPAWKQAAWGGRKWRVPDAEMDRALRVLRPAAYVVYDENATSVELPPGRSTLCSDTSREQHWSSQARQFWSIARCFGLVAAHERARGAAFAYFVRFRADAAPKARVPLAIGEARARCDPAARCLFVQPGEHSDGLALVARAGADAYASTFDEFHGGKCATLSFARARCERELGVGQHRTECLVLAHMRRGEEDGALGGGGVEVVTDARFDFDIVRPLDPYKPKLTRPPTDAELAWLGANATAPAPPAASYEPVPYVPPPPRPPSRAKRERPRSTQPWLHPH